MIDCLCDICLHARSRASAAFTKAGKEWWRHWDEINELARAECEAARAAGYVDPPSRFPSGELLN